jgi:hypothetical protein
MAEPKKVNLVVIDAVKVDGVHYAVGDVLTAVEPDLAKELTGAGRTRLATEADVAPKKARQGA